MARPATSPDKENGDSIGWRVVKLLISLIFENLAAGEVCHPGNGTDDTDLVKSSLTTDEGRRSWHVAVAPDS